MEIFDRYHFGSFIAALLALSVTVNETLKNKAYKFSFGLLLLPLAFYSLAGTHDYFRWNDARWTLIEGSKQMDRIIPPWELNSGHEGNNWLIKTTWAKIPLRWADRNRFQIVMNPHPGYSVLRRLPVNGWLATTPDVVLERKIPKSYKNRN